MLLFLLFGSEQKSRDMMEVTSKMGVKDRPQCYFDVEINREPVGRIVFQLFSDTCPKTSKNFLCLCTGERGNGRGGESIYGGFFKGK
ncbi:hypothetical protein DNTS_022800 [Danionella cerebrum]|uniref:PPIase cyclophilin-type domain-containing protein n=1 Tax=Danionella cerebrum TaxID=2873325 RepID=A0A553MTP6_9TELE|nr:hypothetical protein DNTS_022800 [Danionella translucida]